MRKMIGKLVVDWLRRYIAQREFEYRARNAGVFVIERNEWIPASDLYFQRYGCIAERSFSKWIFALERTLLKAREAFETAAAQALTLQTLIENLERGKRPFDQPGDCG